MSNFQTLNQTFQPSIFYWDYFCDFKKIKENSFNIKIQLNILNSLLWEQNIENKFLEIVREYPNTINVLPILLAVRKAPNIILDFETKEIQDISYLFDKNVSISQDLEEKLLKFFIESWLKNVFQNKYISNLEDYVFWIETWLDSNARKNRTWVLMENLVEEFVKDLSDKSSWFEYKKQATVNLIKKDWLIDVKSDKVNRKFDFAIFDSSKSKVFLFEVNYYWWGWSKLKATAWEYAWLYDFMQNQNISFFWLTDWPGWKSAIKPLEEAYNKMDWNIYNIEMLKNWILQDLIK